MRLGPFWINTAKPKGPNALPPWAEQEIVRRRLDATRGRGYRLDEIFAALDDNTSSPEFPDAFATKAHVEEFKIVLAGRLLNREEP
jgi:hypothetical protein